MNNSFKKRLQDLMSKGESIKSFASRCGLSDSTIRHYIAETSEPTLGKIEQISKACKVSLGWLASGEERSIALDKALLNQIAQIVEEVLALQQASLSTAKKMELILILYEEVNRDGSLKNQLLHRTQTLVNLITIK